MTSLFIAFLVIWIALFGFMLHWQRQVLQLDAAVRELRLVAAPGVEQQAIPEATHV